MEKDAIASTERTGKIDRRTRALTAVISHTPPNWEPQAFSQMRQASYLVHGENGAIADISFVRLGRPQEMCSTT